jgi:hypothetical protein
MQELFLFGEKIKTTIFIAERINQELSKQPQNTKSKFKPY